MTICDMEDEFPRINRHVIDHAFKKFCTDMKNVGEEDKQETTFPPSLVRGRPVGSTATKKYCCVVALKQC